jgi:hypothetical protein
MSIAGDFDRQHYVFDNENHNLIETDSISIDVDGDTFIPNRCRSRKLKMFYIILRLDTKNLFNKWLDVPLKSSRITCSDGTNTIYAKSIVELGYSSTQSSLRKDSLIIKFDYSHLENFNYNKQILKVGLGDLELPDGKKIKSKEVICRLNHPS